MTNKSVYEVPNANDNVLSTVSTKRFLMVRQITACRPRGFLRSERTPQFAEYFAATVPGNSGKNSWYYILKIYVLAYTHRAGTGPENGSFTVARLIQPRCITTREVARLHPFSDWFEFHPTRWHGFRQVGNAVISACWLAPPQRQFSGQY